MKREDIYHGIELISGPAGAGKSAVARELMAQRVPPMVLIEFQPIYAGLLAIDRLPSGRYPERRPEAAYALAMAEYVRRAAITAAVTQGVDAIITNSDGARERLRGGAARPSTEGMAISKGGGDADVHSHRCVAYGDANGCALAGF